MGLELGLSVAALALAGLAVAGDVAVASVRRGRLEDLAADGRRGATGALRLLDHASRTVSALRLVAVFCIVLAGAWGGRVLSAGLGELMGGAGAGAASADGAAFVLVVTASTALAFLIADVLPRRLAHGDPEAVASSLALPLRLIVALASPFSWLLGCAARGLMHLFGARPEVEKSVSEEEVAVVMAQATRAGVIAPAEQQMVGRVLRLADRSVRSVMTPRLDVVWLDPTDPPELTRMEVSASGHSRFPVAEGDLRNLLGITQAKDLLAQCIAGQPLDLRAHLRPPLFVHDSTTVLELLDRFRQDAAHMAIVVDEHGDVEGLVTPADVLEAIVGELPEHDDPEQPWVVRRPDGSLLLDGMLPVDEVEELLDASGIRGKGDYHTLAGFVLAELDRLPMIGDRFEWEGYQFEVVDMDGHRIDRVLVAPADDGGADEAHHAERPGAR